MLLQKEAVTGAEEYLENDKQQMSYCQTILKLKTQYKFHNYNKLLMIKHPISAGI